MEARALSSHGLKASSIASHPNARAPNTTAVDFNELFFAIERDHKHPVPMRLLVCSSRDDFTYRAEEELRYREWARLI